MTGERRLKREREEISSASSSNQPKSTINVFQRCGVCGRNYPVFPSQSTMMGLKSKRSSESCSTGCSKRSRKRSRSSGSDLGLIECIESVATELSILVNEGLITVAEAKLATDYFKEDHARRVLWLKMSRPNQIVYIKDIE